VVWAEHGKDTFPDTDKGHLFRWGGRREAVRRRLKKCRRWFRGIESRDGGEARKVGN